MVIDFHTHVFPDKIAQKTIEVLSERSNLTPNSDGTLDGLIKSMKGSGIDLSVVLPIATKPAQAKSINAFAAQITGKNGIISFGSIHPFSENWKEELSEAADLGLKGIKLHPDYQDFFIDDEGIYPVLDYAKSLGLIIIFHSGVDIGLPDPVHCTPERARRMIDAIGGGKLVFAHTGGFQKWDGVEKYLVGQDIYFDISFSMCRMNKNQLVRIIRNHGADKCLFATDLPWGNQKDDIESIKKLGLNNDELNAIMYANAAKLLGLEG